LQRGKRRFYFILREASQQYRDPALRLSLMVSINASRPPKFVELNAFANVTAHKGIMDKGIMSKTMDSKIVATTTYSTPGAYDDLFRDLRRDDPVHWTEPEGYHPFWTVSRHSDVMEIERQNDRFTNEQRIILQLAADDERMKAATGSVSSVRTLVSMDNPDHRVYRALTQGWFMPPNLKKLEEGLTILAREFVDRLEALGGRCDFVKDVAVWYPLRVIMMILGVQREDDALMLSLTRELFGSNDPDVMRGRTSSQVRLDAVKRFSEYFGRLSAERHSDPRDDLTTVLANATIAGKPIDAREAISYFVIVATAGHDTTSASTAGGLLALMQNPDELRKLKDNPALIPSAIEEMFRWVTPVKHFFRTAQEDYVLRGRNIKAGDSLMMCYQSANRDEEAFNDPFSFKVDRSPNRHLAFGYGAHLCLGMHLARMEMRALYAQLLPRLDAVSLDGDVSWADANFVCGLERLPISYTMRKVAA
jgi:cytochrome P450